MKATVRSNPRGRGKNPHHAHVQLPVGCKRKYMKKEPTDQISTGSLVNKQAVTYPRATMSTGAPGETNRYGCSTSLISLSSTA
jgi:hypothetical protein